MAWLKHKPESKTSLSWHKRGAAVTPGGLRPFNRAPLAMRGATRFLAQGAGAWLEDVDGNRYVDLVGDGGSMILGHADPRVTEAIRQTAALGLGGHGPGTQAILLAEQLQQRLAPVERVRFFASQGRATSAALALARQVSGRRLAVGFSGHFHGANSELLALSSPQTGSGTGAGDLIHLPYGEPGHLAAAFAAHPGEIACVIAEAAPCHMGVIPPPIGFNAQLAKLCRDNGALLILDETLTGFRASATGIVGTEAPREGWGPDLLILGEVIGGGLPLAALTGIAAVMDELAPAGRIDVPADGGNRLACAAGLATLAGCDPALYASLAQTSSALQELIGQELDSLGVPHCIQAAGTVFSVHFGAGPVTNRAGAEAASFGHYLAFREALLNYGVFAPASPFEPWLVSGAHDAIAIEHVAAALPTAAKAAAKAPATV